MDKIKIILFTLAIFSVVQVAQAGDWPMFRHDIAHSGVTDEVVEPTLQVLWKYSSAGFFQTDSPVISGGTVFLKSGSVSALDASTGGLKWDHGIPTSAETSPTVSGGVVYVGAPLYVYAIDANTRSLKWNFKTKAYVLSSPTVSDGTVYVGSGEFPGSSSSSAVHYVYALDASTGSLKWEFQTGNWDSGRVTTSPAVSGGLVFAGTSQRSPGGTSLMYALDASSGSLKWSFETRGNIMSSPSVSGNIVYFGSDDSYVYALDANTGVGVVATLLHPGAT